jgi:hypothetical protein
MRPFPWIIRVGLFAVGFGAGLSHYQAPLTQAPVVEIHLISPEAKPAVSEPPASRSEDACTTPASQFEMPAVRNL